ncbi:MAG: FISUMP domain-containing protein [Patescibacteria group bacterium]|nr:FISUMP domain-containing protein [Patescibacteria group bacterium]
MEQDIQANENNNQAEENIAESGVNDNNKQIFSKPKKKNNKKIILLVGAIVIILGVVASYFLFFSNKEDENTFVLEDEKVEEAEIDKELDSDQDGLPDYIEEVLGTDLNNSDTDGDGYSDFEEMKNGYDPVSDGKYTEEEWEEVKEEIKNRNKGLYDKMFEDSTVNSNNTETDNFVCSTSVVKDIDGNIYNTVKIGDQCWLKENLKVTKNPAGEKITRYCYDNNPSICDTDDGGLYNWDTAMNNSTIEGAQGICPDGWHIPKDLEWNNLIRYLKNDEETCDSAGAYDCASVKKKLLSKESIGFEFVYSGYLYTDESFKNRGTKGYFWSSLDAGDQVSWKKENSHADKRNHAWARFLELSRPNVYSSGSLKKEAYSIRCLRD